MNTKEIKINAINGFCVKVVNEGNEQLSINYLIRTACGDKQSRRTIKNETNQEVEANAIFERTIDAHPNNYNITVTVVVNGQTTSDMTYLIYSNDFIQNTNEDPRKESPVLKTHSWNQDFSYDELTGIISCLFTILSEKNKIGFRSQG